MRFCGNNTGNEDEDHNWGEAICVTDGTLAEATANTAMPEVQFLVIGTPELAMMDNMAYQPVARQLDPPRGRRRAGRRPQQRPLGLPGGRRDDDSLSDGCVRVATLNDLTAEWTGGIFDATGRNFYVSVQHNVTGHGVILKITGWD